ncbi:MAG: shikimate dehydrogenase [Rhodospirillaceae bacterium]|jgi:shikimate dehydrogenase|nr:shikimate dehydrogenase [Rhodospirillaceae bacterium]MBT6140060.1 shikimate dehydrogenase [Rhodospirillaceae bacterium]
MTNRTLIGLIGANIGNSLAPAINDLAFARAGAEGFYHSMDLDQLYLSPDDLPALLDAVKLAGFAGTNVTYPCKQSVIPLLDEIEPAATTIGAVNTVRFRNGRAFGFNTDWIGFGHAVTTQLPKSGQRLDLIAIVGAGGAGRAVAYALANLGVKSLLVYDTAKAQVDGLITDISPTFPNIEFKAAASLDEALDGATGVVNATPIGMFGHPGTPIPTSLLREGLWVGDVIYTPLETELIAAARERDLEVVTGDGMALGQAVAAFELMTDLKADQSAMQSELQRLLVERATEL